MAWIAALISGGIGLAGSSASNQANKKANKKAGALDQQGYQNALANISKYQDIGGAGAISLAELMGMKGYRTKEEQDLTAFLKTRPNAQGQVDWKDKSDKVTKMIAGHPAYQWGGEGDRSSAEYAGAVNLSGLGGITDFAFAKIGRAHV